MLDLINLARQALSLYSQADGLIATVKDRLASSSEARNTDQMDELNSLLKQAVEKRQAASADLDAALAALEQNS